MKTVIYVVERYNDNDGPYTKVKTFDNGVIETNIIRCDSNEPSPTVAADFLQSNESEIKNAAIRDILEEHGEKLQSLHWYGTGDYDGIQVSVSRSPQYKGLAELKSVYITSYNGKEAKKADVADPDGNIYSVSVGCCSVAVDIIAAHLSTKTVESLLDFQQTNWGVYCI
jgi:hypothetical protein